MSDYRIREARVEDCEEILRLIQELAEFEKMLKDCHMTVETLRKDGFGSNPLFRCLVVQSLNSDGSESSGLIGYCIFYYIYSTWEGKCIYMEDLYVTPTSRHKGIGHATLKKLSQICVEEGCKRLQWAVLDWNSIAIDFYNKSGATNLSEKEGWIFYRFDEDSLKAFAKN
ncbi:hypothetical protein SNE40_013667 [Patella caerulea]|uniref:N-acetyltransferase domain-containing protein n=1 Tax=Patella caerulea TaxID=87958 RepID=A0AAN8JGL2_PATCE